MKHQDHADKLIIRFFVFAKTGQFLEDLKGVENFGAVQRLLEEIEAAGDVVIVQLDEYVPLVAFRYTSEQAYEQYHAELLRIGSLLDHGIGAPLIRALSGSPRQLRTSAAERKIARWNGR